ncbi:hypothetical protein AB6A40_002099 [Gnathostoma spinigerum]|uniref:Uncharacterized protein n=1 Tax=Gnathostoma spinigerum TaxID=75299 RepID=A0ABD6EGF6_9BILA
MLSFFSKNNVCERRYIVQHKSIVIEGVTSAKMSLLTSHRFGSVLFLRLVGSISETSISVVSHNHYEKISHVLTSKKKCSADDFTRHTNDQNCRRNGRSLSTRKH